MMDAHRFGSSRFASSSTRSRMMRSIALVCGSKGMCALRSTQGNPVTDPGLRPSGCECVPTRLSLLTQAVHDLGHFLQGHFLVFRPLKLPNRWRG